MNTPIISISEDQNTITHESGNVTVFEQSFKNRITCSGCVYNSKLCPKIIPCVYAERKDNKNGIFKLKHPCK